jgi:hypothetical protein
MAKKGLALGLFAGLGIALVSATPSFAQNSTSAADLLKSPDQGDALNNLFNNRGDGSTTGLLQLMQQLGNPSADPAVFQAQQRENLDAATAEFRAKQRKLLQQQTQPQAVPVAPAGQK